MTSDQQRFTKLAMQALARARVLVPDRVAKVPGDAETAQMMVEEWAFAMRESQLPDSIWPSAVRWWAKNVEHDRLLSIRDLISAARRVMASWESDPVMRQQLDDHRRQRLADRMAGRLASGESYGAQHALQGAPGDSADARAIEGGEPAPRNPGAPAQFRKLRAEIAARARARREAERAETHE